MSDGPTSARPVPLRVGWGVDEPSTAEDRVDRHGSSSEHGGAIPVEVARLAELGVLSASLLHELRQPMFAIKALAQMGQAGPVEEGPVTLGRILDQVRHAEALLEAYAPGGSRGLERIDLCEVVRHAVALAATRIRRSGAKVVLDLCREPVELEVAAVSVRQVVINLLHNALDAIANGKGRQVQLRTRVIAGSFEIEVTDDGPGIPEGMEDRIFEPFVTTKEAGTGLGLYISRHLLRDVGGDLVLVPSARGASFVARLPAGARS